MSAQRIAVIGGGIAGLGAAWLLARRHRVTLIEANDYLGGHTNTIDFPGADGPFPVDSGFIVYNEPNYPNLTALLAHLGVPTQASDMSFAVSLDGGNLEYAGDNLNTLFGQRRNLFRLRFWWMSSEILRFNRLANAYLASASGAEQTLGDFLDEHRFGSVFRRYYLLPMSAAIWSCPQRTMLAFPVARFLRFLRNHGLIQLTGRPLWRTVAGGGREYVQRMRPAIQRILIATPVRRVVRAGAEVHVSGDSGEIGRFDQVVLAAHADTALALLHGPSYWEQRLLGAFGYQSNTAWVHTDTAFMPRRRRLWASWNHLGRTDVSDGGNPITVTYWMNRLQRLPTCEDILVTLNPPTPPRREHVHRRLAYDHPVFDTAAIRAQNLLGGLQGQQRTWFCGSYFGYGFHEDALASAVTVARQLGAVPPWADAGDDPEPATDRLPERLAGAVR